MKYNIINLEFHIHNFLFNLNLKYVLKHDKIKLITTEKYFRPWKIFLNETVIL